MPEWEEKNVVGTFSWPSKDGGRTYRKCTLAEARAMVARGDPPGGRFDCSFNRIYL